jgi:RimJ/RimL family protein N-acetyltransferase|tara:strand:+ start:77 stop:607 length:531 start_codon:yes stop_codon:yes gene_type:complete
MEFKKRVDINFKNKKYSIKQLKKAHIDSKYLQSIEKYKFFLSFPETTIHKQKDYIDKIILSKNKIILGLYKDKNLIFSSGLQLLKKNKISLGILNIDSKYLNKGMAKVFLYTIMRFFKNYLNTKYFIAGVNIQNLPSIKLFKSLNFRSKEKNKKNCLFQINSNNLKNIKYLTIETK